MQGVVSARRLRIGLAGLVVALVAATGFLVMSATASAQGNDLGRDSVNDPLNTNIPYLAWLGEEKRDVKCYQGVDGGVPVIPITSQFFVDVNVLTWSGDPHFKPTIDQSSIRIFLGTGERRGDL